MSDKKRIAIILDEMIIGGIPKACVPFVNELKKYFDVTMIMENDKGAFQSLLPSDIDVIVKKRNSIKDKIKILSRRNAFLVIPFLIKYIFYGHIQKRWVKTSVLSAKYAGPITDEKYDLAIAYHGMNIGHLTRTLYSVNSDKKAAWIHGDHPFEGKHLSDAESVYNSFDIIYNVSEKCLLNFVRDFPETSDKCDVFHCLLNTEEVKKKAEEIICDPFDENDINILTVGRISPEKGQDLIPDIIEKLRGKHRSIKWYLIGDGEDRERIEQIAKQKECKEIVFLGWRVNPYPYMKICDIYVQPSYSEAYSLTAFEAATLGRPIVLTNVAGAIEILLENENAITANPESDKIADAIDRLISDSKLRNAMSENNYKCDFSNTKEVEKIIELINRI